MLVLSAVISYLYWYCKKIKNDPKASYSYEDKDAFEQQWSVLKDDDSAHFTLRKKIILTLFVLPFPIMVWEL